MEKVLIIGPFNLVMKAALNKGLEERFEMEYITSRDEYEKLKTADYVILRTLTLNEDDIATMDRCKLIQRWGAGYDSVDIAAAAKRNIPVAVCYGVNSVSVAEMAVALTLAAYRNIVPMTNGLNKGVYERELYGKNSWIINGKTAGVIGIGNIGSKVAAIYQAFGAKILYYDLYRKPPEDEKKLGIEYVPLDEIWDKCDIITLHVPLVKSTERMINKETLAKMKDGALLINTAREELIDYDALKEALESGKLVGAGIDTIEKGTYMSLPIRGMKNVVLTAHVGGNTADTAGLNAQRCVEQILAVSRGEKLCPPHVVNLNLMK